MSPFEQQLLQHLQNQAEQLTSISKQQTEQATAIAALSSHQEVTSSHLLGLQTSVGEILQALSKEPSGESLETTLKAALQPLQSNLETLITSFNSLSNTSHALLTQLPPQPKP